MRICLLAPGIPGDDPVDLVGRIVAGLAERAAVSLAVTGERTATSGEYRGARVCSAPEAVAGGPWDIAVAMSWQATDWLLRVPAMRRVLWVDEFAHERLGRWQVERIPATLAYDLPIDYLVADRAVADALATRRPKARVIHVAPGLDPVAEPGPALADGAPLRVLIDDRFADEPESGPGLALSAADVSWPVLGPGDGAEARSAAYRAADVLLRLDSVGPPLSVLEAMSHGVVPVVAASGYEQGCLTPGVDSIVVLADDDRGIRSELDALGSDPARLAGLRRGALETAAGWPDWPTQSRLVAEELGRLHSTDPEPDQLWAAELMADAFGAAEVFRAEYFELSGYVERIERDETVVMARRMRQRLDDPRMAKVKRAAQPLTRAMRKRLQ